MRITPKTREEIINETLLPEGVYPAVIDEALEKVANNNKPFISFKIVVIHPFNNREFFIFENIFFDQHGKLLNLAESTKTVDLYESGNMEAYKYIKKPVWIKTKIIKDKEGLKDPQTKIVDFLKEDVFLNHLAAQKKAQTIQQQNNINPSQTNFVKDY